MVIMSDTGGLLRLYTLEGHSDCHRKHCANKIQRLRAGTGLTSGKKGYKKPAEITAATVKDGK